MPFGLKNASATFKRAMDVIIAYFKFQFALLYLYEVVMFLISPNEHIAQVRSVLTLLRDAGVTAKPLPSFKFN